MVTEQFVRIWQASDPVEQLSDALGAGEAEVLARTEGYYLKELPEEAALGDDPEAA